MDLQLRDRVYVVTGGTRGLGRATAEALLGEGARVLLTGRHQESVDQAVDELRRRTDAGGEIAGVAADNADPATPGILVDAAIKRWGRLDGALISVGGPAVGAAVDATDAQWMAAFESVFLGAVRLCREFGARLSDGGSMALVLSSSVKAPIAGLAISNGLRPGLGMFAKNLADELGPRGVRVNALLPGRIATERVAEIDAATGDADAARAAVSATIPLRRYGDPDEFGRVAAFVLSPAASFISGVMLPVDGGLLRAL